MPADLNFVIQQLKGKFGFLDVKEVFSATGEKLLSVSENGQLLFAVQVGQIIGTEGLTVNRMAVVPVFSAQTGQGITAEGRLSVALIHAVEQARRAGDEGVKGERQSQAAARSAIVN